MSNGRQPSLVVSTIGFCYAPVMVTESSSQTATRTAIILACLVGTAACDDEAAAPMVPEGTPWVDPALDIALDDVAMAPDPFTSAIIRTAGDFTYVQLGWHASDPSMSVVFAVRLERNDVAAARPVDIGSASR